jgi:hypothetical protein
MGRRTVWILVALAAVVAAAPLLHTHPLGASADNICATCATGSAQIVSAPASIAAPPVARARIASPARPLAPVEIPRFVPSRAPPAS